MKHLISREDYINEYLRISEHIGNENELYEGLLSAVFGGLKMLLKKDWETVKCKNATVLSHLKEIDKNLGGYTFTKMQYYNECNTIRQNVADYFNDILDYKLLQLEKEENADKYIEKENENIEDEENTKVNGVAKILNLKDQTLLDSLKKYKDNISIVCKKSPNLREYADQLLNSVIVFVNDIVIKELERMGADKEKLEEQKKKLEEERKKLEEERKKKDEEAKKANEEAIKKISDERDKSMRNLGVKPIGPMNGDKAIDTIASQFNGMLGELKGSKSKKITESKLTQDYTDLLKSDTYIGILNSLEELDWKWNMDDKDDMFQKKFTIRLILNKINSTFDLIAQDKDKYKEIPSASVQAMMVALSNVIIYGFVGDHFNIKNDDRLSLISKCAIDSDATIGFNLPLIDPEKPKNGNYFVSIMNDLKNSDINSDEIDKAIKSMSTEELKALKKSKGKKKDDKEYSSIKEFAKSFGPDLMKDFRQNISNLFDFIVKKANDIKKDAEKTREAEAAKAEADSKE
jgi:hypothetical protein